MKYENIISVVLKHIPLEFRDDARQAGYVGLLNGLKHTDGVKNINGYLFKCISNEVLREIASLQRPFALNKDVFCKLLRHRKLKKLGQLGLNSTIERLEHIMSSEQKGLLDG